MSSLRSKRIFLSFLGTGHYASTRYKHLHCGDKSAETRFIQAARLKDLKAADMSPDAIRIFVTADAREKNWRDDGSPHFDTKQTYKGLYTELRKTWPDEKIKAVDVPSGQNESELIEIIKKIVDEVEDNSELYVDLTHGFRTMPLLLGIALRYLEKIKTNVHVRELSYGAYEARCKTTKIAPVFDMTPILALNDWAEAWARFDGSGDVEGLTALITALRGQIGAKEKHDTPRSLSDLSSKIKALHNAMATLRPVELVGVLQDLQPALSRAQADLSERPELQLMLPVIERFSGEVNALLATDEKTSLRELRSQLLYVRWLCERYRNQAAVVILRELLIDTMILRLEHEADLVFDPDDRSTLDLVHFGILIATQTSESSKDDDKASEKEKKKKMSPERRKHLFQETRDSLDPDAETLRKALDHIEVHLNDFSALGGFADRIRSLRNALAHAHTSSKNKTGQTPEKQRDLIQEVAADFQKYLDLWMPPHS